MKKQPKVWKRWAVLMDNEPRFIQKGYAGAKAACAYCYGRVRWPLVRLDLRIVKPKRKRA